MVAVAGHAVGASQRLVKSWLGGLMDQQLAFGRAQANIGLGVAAHTFVR